MEKYKDNHVKTVVSTVPMWSRQMDCAKEKIEKDKPF